MAKLKLFRVNIGKRNRYFATLEEARQACNGVFERTGIVLAIEQTERVAKTKTLVCAECGKRVAKDAVATELTYGRHYGIPEWSTGALRECPNSFRNYAQVAKSNG